MTIELTKRSLSEGKVCHCVPVELTLSISCVPSQCVEIGLQSTGEARTLDQLEKAEGGLTGFVSTAKYECSLSLSPSLPPCVSVYLCI